MGINLNCKQAHRLVSEKLDRHLSLTERVGLRVHLFVCGACRNFDGQMHLIRQAMRHGASAGVSEDKPAKKE